MCKMIFWGIVHCQDQASTSLWTFSNVELTQAHILHAVDYNTRGPPSPVQFYLVGPEITQPLLKSCTSLKVAQPSPGVRIHLFKSCNLSWSHAAFPHVPQPLLQASNLSRGDATWLQIAQFSGSLVASPQVIQPF